MITKDTLIIDALNIGNPEKVARVLQNAGLHCLGCALAHQETAGDIAIVHGVDLEELLAQLNSTIE
jgi:hybrid cluster-associated redox disulfide protein